MDALLRTLVFLVAATGCTESKTSFVKDQDMNAVFPPVNTRTSIDIPEGHLRPLGLIKFSFFNPFTPNGFYYLCEFYE